MRREWKVETHGHGDAPYWVANINGQGVTLYDYADACKLVAARELYDALKGIMDYAHTGAAVRDVYTSEQPQFVAVAKALAKAEGR